VNSHKLYSGKKQEKIAVPQKKRKNKVVLWGNAKLSRARGRKNSRLKRGNRRTLPGLAKHGLVPIWGKKRYTGILIREKRGSVSKKRTEKWKREEGPKTICVTVKK